MKKQKGQAMEQPNLMELPPVDKCPMVYQCINNVMKKIVPVAKNGTNEQQKFKYRAASDIMNMLNPILADEHLVIIPNVDRAENTKDVSTGGRPMNISNVSMTFKVVCSIDGSFITMPTVAMAFDYSDKALYKCYTFAWKNMVQILFSIPTMDDPDSDDIQQSKESAAEEHSSNVIKQLVDSAAKYKIEVKALAESLGAVSSKPETLAKLSLAKIEAKAKELSLTATTSV